MEAGLHRWSPEVSHTLDFSIVEINKTSLTKSRTCELEKEERRKVWREGGRKKE